MVSVGNLFVAGVIAVIFGISLMNPGGGFVALAIALVVLGLYLLVPFIQEYVLAVNKGKAARKTREATNTDNSGREGKQ